MKSCFGEPRIPGQGSREWSERGDTSKFNARRKFLSKHTRVPVIRRKPQLSRRLSYRFFAKRKCTCNTYTMREKERDVTRSRANSKALSALSRVVSLPITSCHVSLLAADFVNANVSVTVNGRRANRGDFFSLESLVHLFNSCRRVDNSLFFIPFVDARMKFVRWYLFFFIWE